jgi:UDP-N-acetyl-D-glucosamine dehydrogenase
VAYKPDINDERESPAFDVIELLENKMATVDYHDPFIPEITISNKQVSSITLTDEALAAYDCVTIITDHSTYDIAYIVNHSQRVVDTRNATKGLDNSHSKIIKL